MRRRALITLCSFSAISIGGISLNEFEINIDNQQQSPGEESTAPNTEEADSPTTNSASTPERDFEAIAEEHKLKRDYYGTYVTDYNTILDIAEEWSHYTNPEELGQWGSDLTEVMLENAAGDPSLGLTPVTIVELDTEVQLEYSPDNPDFYVGHLLSYSNEILSANAFESRENYQEAVRVAEKYI